MRDEKLPELFKLQWMAALLSGDFKQGDGRLKKDGKHCCLGVACEVAGAKINYISDPGFITSFGIYGVLKVPSIIRGKGGYALRLATMNDVGRSFEEIAFWIDENL